MTNFRTQLTAAAAGVIGLFMAVSTTSIHAATDTGSIDVTASVAATCVLGTSTDVAFGPLTMTVGNGTETATGQIVWACTDGTAAPSIGIEGTNNSATREMDNGGSGAIRYNLFQDALGTIDWGQLGTGNQYTALSAGSGIGSPTNVDVYGEIPEANYIDAEPGNYSQTLVVTIEWF